VLQKGAKCFSVLSVASTAASAQDRLLSFFRSSLTNQRFRLDWRQLGLWSQSEDVYRIRRMFDHFDKNALQISILCDCLVVVSYDILISRFFIGSFGSLFPEDCFVCKQSKTLFPLRQGTISCIYCISSTGRFSLNLAGAAAVRRKGDGRGAKLSNWAFVIFPNGIRLRSCSNPQG